MASDQKSPLLVLIHALGADSGMWDSFVALLGLEVRVFAPDLYGVGDTPRHSSPPRAADHADHLATFLRDERAGIVMAGCAVGSIVAAETARRMGEQIVGLVMVNPILRITEAAGAVLLERAARARQGGIAAIADEVIARGFEGLGPEARPDLFRRRLLAMSGDSYADLAEGICGCDNSATVRSLTCPILLVPGGKDRALPASQPQEVAALNARARAEPAPSGGHFLPHQAPEELPEGGPGRGTAPTDLVSRARRTRQTIYS